jgi:hypothetical protein
MAGALYAVHAMLQQQELRQRSDDWQDTGSLPSLHSIRSLPPSPALSGVSGMNEDHGGRLLSSPTSARRT